MNTRIRSMLVALAAAGLVLLGVGTAAASRAIQVEGGARAVTASGTVRFGELRLEAATEITCDVTLLRTIAGSVAKTAGTPFGKVTGVAIDIGAAEEHCRHGVAFARFSLLVALKNTHESTCTNLGGGIFLCTTAGGEARLWNLVYDSFQGTLPRIAGINFHIEKAQFLIMLGPFGEEIECLYEGNVFGLFAIVNNVGRTGEIVLPRTRLRRIEGAFLCPAEATLSGGFTVAPALTIRLV